MPTDDQGLAVSSAARVARAPMPDKIARACLELILQNISKSSLSAIVVSWVLIYFQKDFFSTRALASWAVVTTLVFAVRWYFSVWVLRHDPTLQRQLVWRRCTFALAMVQALCWGYSAWFFFPLEFSLMQAFHLVIITSIGAASVTVLAPLHEVIHGYLLLSQLPLFLRTLLIHDPQHYMMSVMIVLFLFIVWMNATRMHQVIIDSYQLRFTNEDLIEELREAKQAADAASQAKTTFLANMSHEIRTPMNAVLGFTALLQADDPLPHQRERLEIIQTSAKALLRILDNILDLSKIETAHMRLEQDSFDPEPVICEPVELASALLGDRPVEVVSDVDALPPMLTGDGFRLRQILMNLLGNAVKFTHTGFVQLTVRVTETSSQLFKLLFAISDTGIGIPQEHLQKIFEPFSQSDDSVSRRFGGTGLGLAISAKLVSLMGGTLRVTSELNQGSTFSFELPFRAVSTPAPEVVQPGFAHVLIIDDVSRTSDVIATQMRKNGSTVVQVRSLQEAVLTMANTAFDLICVDLTRPGNDPATCSELLRRQARSETTPRFLGITAINRVGVRQSRDLGFDAFCRKPLRPRVFRQTLLSLRQGLPTEQRDRHPGATVSTARRILVVEDEPVNQMLMTMLLKRAGHEVETQEHGSAALERLRTGVFHLVFMDISMPEMNGIEVTWRARKEGCTTPIIICSANAMPEDLAAARSAGANGFLKKPYSFEELQHMIVRHAPQALTP